MQMPASTLTYWREQVQVHIDGISAWILKSEGKLQQALESAKAAADLEDTVDKHPVTPGEVLPARELLADLLLEAGEFSRALVEYETVLENAPNRLNALVGAAEAADNSGRPENDFARKWYPPSKAAPHLYLRGWQQPNTVF